jgi:acyl carrier protein
MKLAWWACNPAIMRGQPHPDNNRPGNILLLSDTRLILKTYVKAPSYSVSCATGIIGAGFFPEQYRVDPQVQEGVSERLISLVRAVLGAGGVVPNPFPLDAQLSDLGISSLKMVNLMLAVEVEFDIAIAQGDITPENFHSVRSIEMLVDRTLAQRT